MQQRHDIMTRGRRVGGASVALLFVVALAAVVIAATQALLVPADTTAAFVPGNAMLYAHANGRAAAEGLLASSAQMPANVHPDEVAVFIVPGDDAPRRGAILAWRWPLLPSAEERSALDMRGADAMDERHYLVHDGDLDTASRVAMAAHASFADDRERAAALALLRSAFPVQIYAVPSELVPAPAAATLAMLQDAGVIDRVVAGATFHDGSFMLRVMPLEAAKARASLFGFRASTLGVSRPGVERLEADVAAAEIAPNFDVTRLLAGTEGSENPDPALLAQAADETRSALARPYALWLRTEATGSGPRFLAWFPTLAPAQAREAVGGYLAAARPDHAPFVMPDGDAAIEYRLGSVVPFEGDADAVMGEGDMKVTVGPDGEKGSLIATDSAFLDAFRTGREPSTLRPACPASSFPSIVVIKDPVHTLAKWPSLSGYAAAYQLHDLTLGLSVDNEVVLCGYSGTTVDKFGNKPRS